MTQALAHLWAKSPSHPGTPGEALTAHLAATMAAAMEIGARVGPLACLPEALRDRFWGIVAWAALTHDCGKVARGFQDMVAGRTRSWGQRHEVLSLGFLPALVCDADRPWVALAVATHHRPLSTVEGGGKPAIAQLYGGQSPADLGAQFGAVPDHDVDALLSWLRTTATAHGLRLGAEHSLGDLLGSVDGELRTLLARWELVDPEVGLAAVLLQGAVTMADHLSSARAHGALERAQPVDVTFASRWRRGRTVYAHQDGAAAVTGHLLLRSRTGSGKTEAGLLWAARQVEDIRRCGAKAPRLFYTLPYLASINAMAGRLGVLLGRADLVGVSHSRASSYHLGVSLADECDVASAARKAVARANATRLFRETVRVGTPYQLLRGALAGPVHSGILLDCANSVFVLDELHSYDARRLGFILAYARFVERLGGRVAVLSATVPAALEELVADTLVSPVTTVQPPPGAPPRHLIRTDDRGLDDEGVRDEIADRIRQGQSVLVVANNVAQATAGFRALAPVAWASWGTESAHLLHSRFRRTDRTRVEGAVHDRWRTGGPRLPGLLVATQVVEVSLDVDFDLLHTSGAPLEALVQRFGRVNRVGAREPAPVTVHRPEYVPRRREPGEYADGVYPRMPVEYAWAILEVHNGYSVDEDALVGWLDQIYASPWGEEWRAEVVHHRDVFASAFLSFTAPMEDREPLADDFDRLFDGTEAVLADDLPDYRKALSVAPGGAGRLVGDDLLIPLPYYAAARARWDRDLRVRVIDADYDPRYGLGQLRGPVGVEYRAGEVL